VPNSNKRTWEGVVTLLEAQVFNREVSSSGVESRKIANNIYGGSTKRYDSPNVVPRTNGVRVIDAGTF
jgi:hypothetical protein